MNVFKCSYCGSLFIISNRIYVKDPSYKCPYCEHKMVKLEEEKTILHRS